MEIQLVLVKFLASEICFSTQNVIVGLPDNAKHRRTCKSGTYEMF